MNKSYLLKGMRLSTAYGDDPDDDTEPANQCYFNNFIGKKGNPNPD